VLPEWMHRSQRRPEFFVSRRNAELQKETTVLTTLRKPKNPGKTYQV